MDTRMIPISVIFSKFPRLVRDLSRKLGKPVDLVLSGEDTEIDRSIVEALSVLRRGTRVVRVSDIRIPR